MPKFGDVARGVDVGLPHHGSHKIVWHACVDCGLGRWVALRRGKPGSSRCYACSRNYPGRIKAIRRGADHWNWKGGRSITAKGYIERWLDPQSAFHPMADKDGYVYEHRLVVAEHLGRCLTAEEEVHHRDGNKHNNELSNLQLLSKSDHSAMHSSDTNALLHRIAELEDAVRRLGGDPHEPEAETA